MSIESVVVAIDGESKCGKTTVIDNIGEEAQFQHQIVPNVLEDPEWAPILGPETREELQAGYNQRAFRSIITISGGNAFRAAALRVALSELIGEPKAAFTSDDESAVVEMLALPGIEDVLQNDPNIGSRVSELAQLPGIQNLCSFIIARSVQDAYHAHDGGNLVVVDARDPVGHLVRNGIVGNEARQIPVDNILPVYIDTSPEVAASRMGGDYPTNLATVIRRREADSTRDELPVIRPQHMLTDWGKWLRQFAQPREALALPLLVPNSHEVDLENIQFLGGWLAAAAHDVALSRNYTPTPLEQAMIDAYQAYDNGA